MSNLRLNSHLYKNDLIQKQAQKPPAKVETADAFVDATSGTINVADLDGALAEANKANASLAGIPVKNSIFIGIKNGGNVEVHRIDLKDPVNLKAIETWKSGLKTGQANLPFPISRLKPDQTTIDSDLGPPRLREDNLSDLTKAESGIMDQITMRWHSAGLNQLQEGQQLSNEQKLFMAAGILRDNGMLGEDQGRAKYLLRALFFDNNSTSKDVIQNVSFTDQGALNVEFASAFDGDFTKRKDLTIAPPTWYTGSDNNSRRAGINTIHNKLPGAAVVNGRTVPAAVPSAYMSQVDKQVERAFLADPDSAVFRSMTPAARKNSAAYQTALYDYKFVHQQNYKNQATQTLLSDLQTFASTNGINLKRATPQELQALTRQAVRTLLSAVENPGTGVTFITSARTPAQFSLEDEAAVEDAMRQLTGATVNLDATPANLAGFISGSGNAQIQPAR